MSSSKEEIKAKALGQIEAAALGEIHVRFHESTLLKEPESKTKTTINKRVAPILAYTKDVALILFNLIGLGLLVLALQALQFYGLLYQNTVDANFGVLMARNIALSSVNTLAAFFVSSLAIYSLNPLFYRYENPFISEKIDLWKDFSNIQDKGSALRFGIWCALRLLFFALSYAAIMQGDRVLKYGMGA